MGRAVQTPNNYENMGSYDAFKSAAMDLNDRLARNNQMLDKTPDQQEAKMSETLRIIRDTHSLAHEFFKASNADASPPAGIDSRKVGEYIVIASFATIVGSLALIPILPFSMTGIALTGVCSGMAGGLVAGFMGGNEDSKKHQEIRKDSPDQKGYGWNDAVRPEGAAAMNNILMVALDAQRSLNKEAQKDPIRFGAMFNKVVAAETPKNIASDPVKSLWEFREIRTHGWGQGTTFNHSPFMDKMETFYTRIQNAALSAAIDPSKPIAQSWPRTFEYD